MSNRRPGWDPTRRNRNQGTPKRGHGRDNRDGIPKAWPDDRVFYEVLHEPVVVKREVHGEELTFLVERPRAGCIHPCTVDDVCRMLGLLEGAYAFFLDLVLFRQPTRRQVRHSSVWGRLIYYAGVGHRQGPAICLEAQELGRDVRWPRSLTPYDEKELDRLRSAGFEVLEDKRGYWIETSGETLRNSMLYRKVPHEVGHLVDWMGRVVLPDHETEEEARRADDLYHSRPEREREEFAHRFAEAISGQLRASGSVPFDPIVDRAAMARDGLDPAWFGFG